MARMLRTVTSYRFGCCSHCARRARPEHKPGPEERRNARAIEKRRWRKEEKV